MPFFGVPIRNGLPIGLGSVAGFGVQQFDPSQLFEGGTVAGAWYDPSDLSTMFDTSAGTTPVAMPGQGAAVSVGLMLDKSQGLVLGSELVTNGDFDTDSDWTKGTGWTIAGGVATHAAGTASNLDQANVTTPGKWYEFTVEATASGGTWALQLAGGTTTTVGASLTTGNFSFIALAAASNTTLRVFAGSGTTLTIDNISVRELPGNHAISFNNTTARPELRARVNLLTYSEEFDNGAWTKTNVTILANSITAPDGTTTADTVIETATTNTHLVDGYPQIGPAGYPAGTFAFTCYAKAKERSAIALSVNTSITSQWTVATFDLTTGVVSQTGTGGGGVFTLVASSIIDAGNGWYQCVLRFSATAIWWPNIQILNATTYVYANYGRLSYTGDGTSGIYIWGADLRPANIGANVPAYQRIADANTYDTSGFPLHLRFDGIDDGMNVPGSASAMKFMHSALSSVCLGVNFGISADPNAYYSFFGSNEGTSANVGIACAYDDRTSVSLNNALRSFTTNGVVGFPTISTTDQNVLLPITPNVVFYNSDPANATAANRYTAYVNNGSALATNAASDAASTANSTYDLQIGANGNSLSLALMSFYGLVIVNATITGGQRTATQSWIAGKMGITLP